MSTDGTEKLTHNMPQKSQTEINDIDNDHKVDESVKRQRQLSILSVKLTDQQTAKVHEMKKITEKWNLKEPEREFLTDMCHYRFLKGWGWDIKATEKALLETVKWREEYKPQEVTLKDVAKVAKQSYLFSDGFDLHGRPIIYLQLGKDKTNEDWDLKMKYIVYIMETTQKTMIKGVYSTIWLIDLKGVSGNIETISAVKDMFIKLGDYYSETLGQALIINSPLAVSLLWGFLKPFLAKSTVEKFVFLSGTKKKVILHIQKYISLDSLISIYGGNSKFEFDFDKSLQEEENKNKKE
eukprot:gene10273-2692_t